MPNQPYIIFAPPYAHCSAGIRVLHKLGHLLNEAGEKAFIYENKTNPEWNISSISAVRGKELVKNGAIVIYPEITFGNPLWARTVVRYILNNPGLLGGDKSFDKSEILFCFSKILLQPGMGSDRILTIPTIDTKIFYNDYRKRDIDYLVYFGKHKKVKGYPEKFIIYPNKPSHQEDLGKLLRRCKKLITYDNFTALIFEATLCGCPVVIIPDGFRKREELESSEVGLNGVAWGDTPEEFLKAQETLPKAKEILEKLERNVETALVNFIKLTQQAAEERARHQFRSVSIIVLNYNGENQLKQNFPSIAKVREGATAVEIMVIDNASNDGSVNYLKNNFPQVKLVCLDKNYSFCKGLNEGAKVARNELLLFLNNDIEVTKDFLSPLLEHFDDPQVFGVSPKVIRPTQDHINESLILGSFEGGVINANFIPTQKLELPDIPLEVFSLCGAAFIVDKAKFLEIDGLDEAIHPFYYEETDLSYRALKRGWKLIYEPRSVVYHQHNQTIGRLFSKSYKLWSHRKNQYLCVWKNISDPWLLAQHLFQMVIPKLLIPNLLEWSALFKALSQLPDILKKRRRLMVSDRKIFKWAAQQSKIVKLKARVRKILIIRPESIGDVVLSLPAIQTLRKNFPRAKITYLTRRYILPLLKDHPDIDEIIHDYHLQKYHFDLSANFYNQANDTLAAFMAKIPYRLGDSARVLTGWMNNLRVFRKWNDLTRHEIDHYLDLLRPLGINDTAENLKPQIIPSKSSLEKIQCLLSQAGIKNNDFLAGVHIGPIKSRDKSWSTVGYAEVIDWLLTRKAPSPKNRIKVVLTGEGTDVEKAEKIVSICKNHPINLVGKLTLDELIALTSQYHFYLGLNTGPTHIAAAFDVPLVAIFLPKGETPLRWGPWKTRHLTVRKPTACEKVCSPLECDKNICLEEIDARDVIAACDEILNGGGVVHDKETFYHWCQKTFRILITCHPRKNARAEAVQNLLQEAGYTAAVINPFLSTWKLFDYITTKEITIVHSLDDFKNRPLRLATYLSGTRLSTRTLWVKDKNREYKTAEELIHLYTDKFRSTTF